MVKQVSPPARGSWRHVFLKRAQTLPTRLAFALTVPLPFITFFWQARYALVVPAIVIHLLSIAADLLIRDQERLHFLAAARKRALLPFLPFNSRLIHR